MRAAFASLSLMLLIAHSALADDKDKLVSSWKIVSAVVEDIRTHEQKPLYGDQTDEERSAAYRSMVAYRGQYLVKGDIWITTPNVAWNDAWLKEQVRSFKLDGDKLYVETAPAMNPNFGKVVRVTLVWQREE